MAISVKSTKADSKSSQMLRYWELLYVLAEREIKVRYRGSFLGVYWSLFNPLIMTVLYTTIFGAVFKKYYHNSVSQYVLAAFTGLVVIHFYQGSTSQALASVVSNGSLLNKIRLPVSVFPLSTILANTCQLAIGMFPLLSILTLVISHNPWLSLINVIAIPLPLIALILVSTGIGFIVSALYVFFRDLPFFYELVQFVLWLSSPVFYPAAIVDSKIRPLLELNPLYPIIESLRQIVLSGNLPDSYLIIRAWLSGLIILGIGIIIFNWLRPKFMDLL
ncbi:ABC transporter permease [Chamaesiphon sp. VAR_48_metabat_135_sub]|uniref:ABC transporter permease n=1 Tax=Chamaesiphon sp. VAR_48_metabat_135_sub TaxID=2964699 RepID=UPI00286CD035|nr:ABC transporter permease [Chamaesiphon sp. VAR_48_metabat_135_sub]